MTFLLRYLTNCEDSAFAAHIGFDFFAISGSVIIPSSTFSVCFARASSGLFFHF
jgi:hypothetical protein